MKNLLLISAMGLALAGLAAPQVQATPYVVTLTQQGSNVIAHGSGAIDLAGLAFVQSYPDYLPDSNGYLVPSLGAIATGSEIISNSDVVDAYSGSLSGPMNFGGGIWTRATSSSGDFVQILEYNGTIAVPTGYSSDSVLLNTSTWDNATFASLGLTVGSYVWRWGSGANQGFTLDVQAPTSANVPEPSSLALLGAGLIGLLLLRRRKATQLHRKPAPPAMSLVG